MPVKLSRVKVRKGYCMQKLGELNWCMETGEMPTWIAESMPLTNKESGRSDRAGALLELCDRRVEGIGDIGIASIAVRIAAYLDCRNTLENVEELMIRREASSILSGKGDLDWGRCTCSSLSVPGMEVSSWKADSMGMCAVAVRSHQFWSALVENKEK